MYGALIGDLAGSIYEYDQLKNVHSVQMNNLIEENAFYSDDTILTIAVLDAILNGGDTDTNCAIVGSVAEAMYGIDDELIEKVNGKIPQRFVKILKRANKC